jgi:hypothetical protein
MVEKRRCEALDKDKNNTNEIDSKKIRTSLQTDSNSVLIENKQKDTNMSVAARRKETNQPVKKLVIKNLKGRGDIYFKLLNNSLFKQSHQNFQKTLKKRHGGNCNKL